MKPDKPSSEDLRLRAEARMNSLAPPALEVPTALQVMRQVHELQVQQVELEMQHEELEHTRAQLEEALAGFKELYDLAPVGYLSLEPSGSIVRANLEAGRLLGLERALLMTRRFADFFAQADRSAFTAYLEQAFLGEAVECAPHCVAADAVLAGQLLFRRQCRPGLVLPAGDGIAQ